MSWDLYSAAGIAAIVVAAGVVGLRMIRDEAALRRKRILAKRY